MIDDSLQTVVRVGGFTLAGSLFWLMYLDLKDALTPEPRHLLVLAFLLGCGANVVGLALYQGLGALGVRFPAGAGAMPILLYCLLVIGPLEEGVKFTVTRGVLFRSRHFDEHLDGLVYPGAVAIGFAAVENVLQAAGHAGWEQLARAAAAPAVHSVFAMIWGVGAAHAWFRAKSSRARLLWQVVPLGAAMMLHGLYDFALLGLSATYIACALFGILWIAMVLYSRVLLSRDAAEGGRDLTPEQV